MKSLRASGRPFGVQVIGDPFDAFAPGTLQHPLRPFFRWWYTRQLEQQVSHAACALYVPARATLVNTAADMAARTAAIKRHNAAMASTAPGRR